MTPELRDIIAEAADRFGFRKPGPFETDAAYRAALTAHVEPRHFAAGHELRIGRRQSDWTADDCEAFKLHCLRETVLGARGPRAFVTEARSLGVRCDTTTESLLSMARGCLQGMIAARTRAGRGTGDAEVPILALILLDDGEVWMAGATRADRFALLKAAARSRPVYGYALLADALIHSIDRHGTAQASSHTTDALVAQVGTRETRHILARPYHFEGDAVVFDEPRPDVDVRKLDAGSIDPYADIFVSVPAPERAQ